MEEERRARTLAVRDERGGWKEGIMEETRRVRTLAGREGASVLSDFCRFSSSNLFRSFTASSLAMTDENSSKSTQSKTSLSSSSP
jgi:hypothetical protein